MTGSTAARRALHALRRNRATLDFSDYLSLRALRDEGERDDDLDAVLAHLERVLPVAFERSIPHLVTLDDAPAEPPRGLAREHVRVALAMRAEFARHGEARAGMMGIDLPERPGLPDWLDLVEGERKHAMELRKALRDLDRRIWAMFTGDRRMPAAPRPAAWELHPSRMLHQ